MHREVMHVYWDTFKETRGDGLRGYYLEIFRTLARNRCTNKYLGYHSPSHRYYCDIHKGNFDHYGVKQGESP